MRWCRLANCAGVIGWLMLPQATVSCVPGSSTMYLSRGRAAGVPAGVDDERAAEADLALAPAHRVLVEKRHRQVPVHRPEMAHPLLVEAKGRLWARHRVVRLVQAFLHRRRACLHAGMPVGARYQNLTRTVNRRNIHRQASADATQLSGQRREIVDPLGGARALGRERDQRLPRRLRRRAPARGTIGEVEPRVSPLARADRCPRGRSRSSASRLPAASSRVGIERHRVGMVGVHVRDDVGLGRGQRRRRRRRSAVRRGSIQEMRPKPATRWPRSIATR